uniref:Uncharacterized protein n=1 Tax=Zea mays TaxID=4577 RepID=A0A804PFF3_MAIZE
MKIIHINFKVYRDVRTYLGCEDLEAGVLDVPAELGDGPAGAAERLGVVEGVAEVVAAAGGPVQPERRPQQLVLVAAGGRVVALDHVDAFVVAAAVGVGEFEQLLRVVEQQVRVVRVPGAAEHGGRGGHGGGGLGGDLGARVLRVHLVRAARRGHVLGPLPAVVVRVAVPDLRPQLGGRRVRLHEVVGAPLDGLQRVRQLPRAGHAAAVLQDAPGQQRHRERHGQAELHVVSGVVVPAHQVHPLLQPVRQPRVAPPPHPLVVRQPPRPLRLEVEQALAQRIAVVVRGGGGGGERDGGQGQGHEADGHVAHCTSQPPATTTSD